MKEQEAAGGMTPEEVARQFLRHQQMVQDYIYSLVRDPHDSDDLFQEVGVRVLAKAVPPRNPEDFPSWCRGIARNLVLHHWRSKRRGTSLLKERFLRAVETAYQESENEADLLNLKRRALNECLKKLPEPSRDLLEMRYVRGAPSHVIAERIRQSAAGVRMTLMRIRQALDSCIQSRLAGDLKS